MAPVTSVNEGDLLTRITVDSASSIVHRRRHAGIVRLVTLRAEEQGRAAVHALHRFGPQLLDGAIVTIEPGRVRLRPREDSF